jgi:2-iminobutanoate/2-iminopropanoate deaminase
METHYHHRELEKSIPYSSVRRHGDLIFLAGVVSWDAQGAPIGVGSMQQQLRTIYDEIGVILKRYGAGLESVIKETIFTTDMEALKAAAAVRSQAYSRPAPASTWVEVKRLILPELLVEVELIAGLR